MDRKAFAASLVISALVHLMVLSLGFEVVEPGSRSGGGGAPQVVLPAAIGLVGLASPRPPDPNEEAPADAAPVVVAAATTTGLVPPPVLSAPARDHPADLGPDSNRERGAPPGPGSPPASFLRGRHLDHRLLGPLAIQTEGGPSRVEVPATADPSLWTVREVESERRGLLSGQTLLGLVTDEERLLILAMRAQTRRWDLEERGRILRARLDRARDSLR